MRIRIETERNPLITLSYLITVEIDYEEGLSIS